MRFHGFNCFGGSGLGFRGFRTSRVYVGGGGGFGIRGLHRVWSLGV